MPRHINPKSSGRTAMAPYNFVPLPNKVLTVEEGLSGECQQLWERHDEFVPGTYSGWIDLDILTLTPLYIRGAVLQKDGAWDSRDSCVRPEAFQRPDGTPGIPGSSLRGMVRTLVEILSFAKIQLVSTEKPFFRALPPERIGRLYQKRVIRQQVKPSGGFVRISGDLREIVPCCVLEVPHRVLERDLKIELAPIPSWKYQHKRCFVKTGTRGEIVTSICLGEKPPGAGWQSGYLVMSGLVEKKAREYVFLDPVDDSVSIPIPDHIWERFHDDDQITQWQEKAFPKNKPFENSREADGHLRDGEPVFYVTDDGEGNSEARPGRLVFLGRARMFRFPYDKSPYEMVPESIRDAGLDLAEMLFGYVPAMSKGASPIKGRLRFQDSVAVSGGPPWYVNEDLVPRILSSPKVTTFQHYLTQDGEGGRERLTSYLDGDYTTIRGFKLYWHRWNPEEDLGQVREEGDQGRLRESVLEGRDKQHTIIRPVRAGVTFRGRIDFYNLAAEELGALLCALDLPEGCKHKLGMGKPLGLGSVSISLRLTLVDRHQRYSNWAEKGLVEADSRPFKAAFEEMIMRHAKNSNEVMIETKSGLRRIARLDALYTILQWDTRPDPSQTRYMTITGDDRERFGHSNEFRNRPVLPTPHRVMGKDAPNWAPDPPKAVFVSGETKRARDSRRTAGSGRDRRGGSRLPQRDARTSRSLAQQGVGQSSIGAQLPRPIRVGDVLEAEVLEETSSKGKAIVRLPNGKKAVVQNDPGTGHLTSGTRLRVVYVADGHPYPQVRMQDG